MPSSEINPIAFEEQVATFLDKHEIYDLFADLVSELALRLPDDPVDFLIKKLKSSQKMRVFVFGATGDKVSSICSQAALSSDFKHIKTTDMLEGLDSKSPSFDRELSGKLAYYLAVSIR